MLMRNRNSIILVTVGLIFVLKIMDDDDNNRHKEHTELLPNQNSFPVDTEFVWGFSCVEKLCKKVRITENLKNKIWSLQACRLHCGDDIGTLWPKPSIISFFEKKMVPVNIKDIEIPSSDERINRRLRDRLKGQIEAKISNYENISGDGAKMNFDIRVNSLEQGEVVFFFLKPRNNDLLEDPDLTMKTDESYVISSRMQGSSIKVSIFAPSYFGVRHALETLSQLIVYDEIYQDYFILPNFDIRDKPKFPYRGLLLDTSRNYFSVESIKRTLDAMAMVKLNTFHWHITDAASFPVVLKSQPDLSKYGSYSKYQVYTAENIRDVVNFAKLLGIRVIPEMDAPAHVAEGWQYTNLTTCLFAKPSKTYCSSPPCGQLDPTKDKVYDVLEDIYREFLEMFGPIDMFHMGGDEVSINCWNSSKALQNWMLQKNWTLNETYFHELWGHFQKKALERFDKADEKKSNISVILWTSSLTNDPYLTRHLDHNRYIIQVWMRHNLTRVKDILKEKYKIIVSNSNAFYLDCGFSSWLSNGLNSCSPYKSWQKIYDSRMSQIAGEYVSQVLGGEACMWGEQVDERNLDGRLWPRLSALAENLWSDPKSNWKEAVPRMLMNRKRLVENGIDADRLQPNWCLQNEGACTKE